MAEKTGSGPTGAVKSPTPEAVTEVKRLLA